MRISEGQLWQDKETDEAFVILSIGKSNIAMQSLDDNSVSIETYSDFQNGRFIPYDVSYEDEEGNEDDWDEEHEEGDEDQEGEEE